MWRRYIFLSIVLWLIAKLHEAQVTVRVKRGAVFVGGCDVKTHLDKHSPRFEIVMTSRDGEKMGAFVLMACGEESGADVTVTDAEADYFEECGVFHEDWCLDDMKAEMGKVLSKKAQ